MRLAALIVISMAFANAVLPAQLPAFCAVNSAMPISKPYAARNFATLGAAVRHCGADSNNSIVSIMVVDSETKLLPEDMAAVPVHVSSLNIAGMLNATTNRSTTRVYGNVGATRHHYSLSLFWLDFDTAGDCTFSAGKRLTAQECVFRARDCQLRFVAEQVSVTNSAFILGNNASAYINQASVVASNTVDEYRLI